MAEQSTTRTSDGDRHADGRNASLEVPHPSPSDQVYPVLWQQIVNWTLRPGDKISDLPISGELFVPIQ